VDYVIKIKILIGLGLSRTVSFQGSTLELAIICICLGFDVSDLSQETASDSRVVKTKQIKP